MRSRMIDAGLWDSSREEALRAQLLSEVNAAIEEAEKMPPPATETIFDDVYAELPWNLAEQKRELLAAKEEL
jgi:pyruvate dehydrogenase E1 component alpha subunit/2-oxoisovalerate dehydrogenase E1 component alpha subunit